MYENYLLTHHNNELLSILADSDVHKHFSININFLELFENDTNYGNTVLKVPEKTLSEWNDAAIKAQTLLLERIHSKYLLKSHVNCRIYGLPICPELHRTLFPNNEDAGKLLQISGTVVRISATKLLEYQRQYICVKCKYSINVTAEYDKNNVIAPPKHCTNPEGCKGTNLITLGTLDSVNCKDYQEIKIQEEVSKLGVGSIPNSMWVTLDDDLVDKCKPGDSVTICCVVKQRWGTLVVGKKIDVELVLKANHVQVNNTNESAAVVTAELQVMFKQFWERHRDDPLAGRDVILKSFCPQIFGLHIVKLAIAVVLAGGSQPEQDSSSTGVRIRSESHLLLVGDPGTGKSHLLRFAAKIIPRSVLTTGVGSTAAGLTVTALMEKGEWQLEGGALVMSDGGICCIDEFNSMKEHDRTSIHEAMEQQTISVAKASIVCKLHTRCSILAACNPKGGNLDPSQPLGMNIALASPLLSRFDLILLLRDNISEDWDTLVVDYILNGGNNYSKLTENVLWTIEMLQAYFASIKKLNPVLSSDARLVLSNYYQLQRRINDRNKARTTVRLLDSLVRLSQGHARLMYHDEVQVVDAVYAVILVDTSMEADAALLNLSLSSHSMFPENPAQDYKNMIEIILHKLNLDEMLAKEVASLGAAAGGANRVQSRFFSNDEGTNNEQPGGSGVRTKANGEGQTDKGLSGPDRCMHGNDEEKENVTSKTVQSIGFAGLLSKKQKRSEKTIVKSSKKCKKTNVAPFGELEMLHLMPSVNDVFELNFNEPIMEINETDLETSFSNCISSTQNGQKSPAKTPHVEENVRKSPDCSRAKNRESSEIMVASKMQLFRERFTFRPRECDNTKNGSFDASSNVKSVPKVCSSQSIFENNDNILDNLDLDV